MSITCRHCHFSNFQPIWGNLDVGFRIHGPYFLRFFINTNLLPLPLSQKEALKRPTTLERKKSKDLALSLSLSSIRLTKKETLFVLSNNIVKN